MRRVWMVLGLMWALGCDDGAEVGEACDTVGSKEDCVDGAICTNDTSDNKICREICDDHPDCPEGQSCNGVSGTSTKSCQPD